MTFDMRLALACALGAAFLVLPACDGGEAETETTTVDPRIVTITMTEDSCDYLGPMSVRDGRLTMEFLKETDGDGAFELLRVARAATFDELEQRVEADSERIQEGNQPVGYQSLASLEVSAELIGPDDRQRVVEPLRRDLEPGTHAILCIQESGLGVAGPLEITP